MHSETDTQRLCHEDARRQSSDTGDIAVLIADWILWCCKAHVSDCIDFSFKSNDACRPGLVLSWTPAKTV